MWSSKRLKQITICVIDQKIINYNKTKRYNNQSIDNYHLTNQNKSSKMFTRVVNRFSRPARASMTRTAARFNNTVAPQQTQQANSGKSYLPYGCGLAFAGMGVKQSDGTH